MRYLAGPGFTSPPVGRIVFGVGQRFEHDALLAELAELALIDPPLVESEIRPLVESLRARAGRCARAACGRPFLRKRRHRGARGFCSATCRSAARRPDAA